MSVWSITLEAFRNQVSANTPVPSCGAAACVCANFGLALIIMAVRNTAAKKRSAAVDVLIESAEALEPVLSAQADNDVRTFDAYIDETAHGVATHSEQRTLDITLGALAAARSGFKCLMLAEQALEHVAPHLRGDVVAGALIVHASLSALLLNVDSDASHLESEGITSTIWPSRKALQEEADSALQRIRLSKIL